MQHHYKHLYDRQLVLYPKQPKSSIYEEETDIDDESGDSESDIMSSVESDSNFLDII